jgi:hypothetical protein
MLMYECNGSSNVCRMAAIAHGWEGAFGLMDGDREDGTLNDDEKQWVEIDNAGVIVPQWEPFELF